MNEATVAGKGGFRWGWMRFMYALNLLAAGVPGLLALFGPASYLSSVPQDRLYFGVLGSIWLTIGVLSFLGLRRPLQFSAIFVVQIVYKSVWFVVVFFPLAVAGELRFDALPLAAFFALAIVVCSVATPWRYLLGGDEARAAGAA